VAELDRVREQIAYLKYWQGIMVVTDISLVGWFVTASGEAGFGLRAMALVAIVALTLWIMNTHRHITRRIEETGRL
jgi:hypothetical protein